MNDQKLDVCTGGPVITVRRGQPADAGKPTVDSIEVHDSVMIRQ
jgi:hypothetical protein